MNKFVCQKCNTAISASNIKKHTNVCTGLGTWQMQEELRKYKYRLIKNFNCEYCLKSFKSIQGLIGHRYRSHLNKEKQKIYAHEGFKKQKELGIYQIGYKHTEETKQKLSEIACTRLAKHSKYTKNIEYKSGVILESTYEVRVAEILDKLKIKWEKVRCGYIWDDNGKQRRYIPDFYLPKYNLFLDPKNDFLIKKDKRKIDSAMQLNNIKVIILSNKEINEETIKNILL